MNKIDEDLNVETDVKEDLTTVGSSNDQNQKKPNWGLVECPKCGALNATVNGECFKCGCLFY